MRHQYWQWRPREQAPRSSSQNEFTKARVTIRSHDKQVGVVVRNMRLQNGANAASPGIENLQRDNHSMPCQILCELFAGSLGIDHLLIGDGYDEYFFRFFKMGSASATALDAGRPKSHATTTVSSVIAPLRTLVCGRTMVGRPEPKMIDSAHD